MFLSVRIAVVAACFAFSAASAFAAEKEPAEVPVLVAASATSSAEGASSVICLLNPKCEGSWRPAARDGGADEGLYLRFLKPALIDGVEVIVAGNNPPELSFYFDGRSVREKGKKNGEGEDNDRMLFTESRRQDDDTVFYLRASGEEERLNYLAQSLFIKISGTDAETPPAVRSIRFFTGTYSSDEPRNNTPLDIKLPQEAAGTAAASSTLAPEFAYAPSRLFDSQMDMAFATDGKKNDGTGESVTLSFEKPQTVAGLLVWNGYQRSETHFRANGRVKRLDLNGQSIALRDEQGMQAITLPAPITAKDFRFVFKEIYPGGTYKDLLLSELRLLSPDGAVLLPEMPAPKPEIPAELEPMLDLAYASVLNEAGETEEDFAVYPEYSVCKNARFRMRSNGGFVIYRNGFPQTIFEGGWEPAGQGAVRLFGKTYAAPPLEGANYLRDTAAPGGPVPRIFQTRMNAAPFNSLDPKEQTRLVLFLAEQARVAFYEEKTKENSVRKMINLSLPTTETGKESFTGATWEEAAEKTAQRLRELNPVAVRSDRFTDILLPAGKVSPCWEMP